MKIAIPKKMFQNKVESFFVSYTFVLKYAVFSLFSLIPFAPVILKSDSITPETSAAKVFFMFAIFMIGLFAVGVLFTKDKLFSDTHGFVNVLTFALFSLLSIVVLSTFGKEVTNIDTFGKEELRSASNFVVISFVVIFYITSIVADCEDKIKQLLNCLVFGALLFILYSFLFEESILVEIVSILILPLLAYKVITKSYSFYFYLLAIASSLVLIQDRNLIPDYVKFLLFFSTSVAGFVSLFFVYILRKELIVNTFYNLRLNFKAFLRGLNGRTANLAENTLNLELSIVKVLLILSPFIFLAFAIGLILNTDTIGDIYSDKLDQYSSSFEFVKNQDDAKNMLFGVGGYRLDAYKPFLINILETQGVVAFLSYIFFTIYSIYSGIVFLIYSIRNKSENLKLAIALNISILSFAVLSVFFYVGLTAYLIWLMIFIILSNMRGVANGAKTQIAEINVYDIGKRKFNIGGFLFTSKHVNLIRYLLIIAILIFAFVTMYRFGTMEI